MSGHRELSLGVISSLLTRAAMSRVSASPRKRRSAAKICSVVKGHSRHFALRKISEPFHRPTRQTAWLVAAFGIRKPAQKRKWGAR